jgi:hypothetical protein
MMKKSLLLLVATLLLPIALGAQALAPSRIDLPENQKLLGHYTTDALSTKGWGKTGASGVLSIATEMTADELALFQGGKIVAFRIGLYRSTPISRVFVVPVDGNGNYGDFVEWPCEVSTAGWNIIELSTPYDLNLPPDYSLMIGFDYYQARTYTAPLSVVNVGTIYPSVFYTSSGEWMPASMEGNLSLQCIVENDNFPDFVIRMRSLTSKARLRVGDDLPFSFETCKMGDVDVPAGACTYEISIDGVVVNTITNSTALTNNYVKIASAVNTADLSVGAHTLTVSAVSVNGETLENPVSISCTFLTFEFGFTRQMRLVEQFTSTGCTFCPQGTANIQGLCNMRNDIAWVAIHENMNGPDPFMTAQTDSIDNLQGIDGYPEGTFDRTAGISSANSIYAVLTNLSPSTMSDFFDYVEELSPSWATVHINSTIDNATRTAVITVNGDLVQNYEDFMGADSKLTVYITEDGLVAPQTSGGNDYVHNNVLRQALVSIKGVALNKTGDTYKNEFTVTIPNDWNIENLNIVAFVSRPLGNRLTDLFVTNANKRKLGEADEPIAVTPGDMNGDGMLNVADVTALIGVVLNGEAVDLEIADLTGDGIVNVADVTALIALVLNN